MYHLIAVLLLSVSWWPIFAAAPSAVRVSSADSKVSWNGSVMLTAGAGALTISMTRA